MSERDIFLAAIEIPVAADRKAYLDQACAGDAFLRAQVDALLKAYDDPKSFLAHPAVEQVAGGSGNPPVSTSTAPGAEQVVDNLAQSASEATESFSRADPDGVLAGLLAPSTVPGSLGRLGHFEVQQVLGTGGFGTVLRAFDDKLHRMVAIKLMSAEMASTSPARKRFLREARAAAAIRHENVVNIHSVEEEPLPYLVMEFVPGQTLEQKLNGSGPLELSEVLRLGEQIAQGLAAAHAMGLVHRDIKPANILLESGVKERVKITDFGLARTADDATVTQSGVIAGTPMYMAPEQAWGLPLDQRADLFSLGSVLYQMVSGRPPFRAETTLAVLKRVTEDKPRPIQEIIPETPSWLCAIIARLQEKQPEDRIQTARELADLLGQCRKSLELGTEPKLPWPVPAACVRTIPPVAPIVRPAATRSRSRWFPRPVWSISALLVLLALAVGIFVLRATPDVGTLVIEVDDPEVSISISGEGIGTEITRGVRNPRVELRPGRHIVTARKNGQLLEEVVIEIKSGHRDVLKLDLTARRIVGVTPTPGWHGWVPVAPAPANAPFNAEQAKQHQVAWADFLKVPVVYTNSIGMQFVLIPPGEYVMGNTPKGIESILKEGQPPLWQEFVRSEGPQHKVILTQPFYLGVHEVTQSQFERVMGTNPAHFAPTGEGKVEVAQLDTTDFPAERVSWIDATEFCVKLGQREQLKPFYFHAVETVTPLDGNGYRLPSEAEWEFACRAGTTTAFWSGDQNQDCMTAGWTGRNSGKRTHAVGELKANPFGLYDVHGNVWEFVNDFWDPDYYAQLHDRAASNHPGSSSATTQRVARGGVWADESSRCRSTSRYPVGPGDRTIYFGFRVSLPVETVRTRLRTSKTTTPMATESTSTTDQSAPSDSDRRTAEWVLSMDGKLSIETNGKRIDVASVADLPAGLWDLVSVDLTDNKQIVNADLEHLEGLTNLTKLILSGTVVGDGGLVHLETLTKLTSLDLSGTEVRGAGLVHLQGLSNLRELSLDSTAVSGGLVHLKGLTNLNVLCLGSAPVSDVGLEHLKGLTNLTSLDLGHTKLNTAASLDAGSTQISDAGLKHLETLTNLTSLDLGGTQISNVGLVHLKALTNLRELWLQSTPISDAGLIHLQGLTKLTNLCLDGTRVTDAGLVNLKKLINLKELRLQAGLVNDAGLVHLKGLTNLTRLWLHTSQVGDAGLLHLTGLTNLTELGLYNTKVTRGGVEVLRKALPKCNIESVFPISDPDRQAAEWVLSIDGSIGIRQANQQKDITKAADLPAVVELLAVSLPGNTRVTDSDLAHLKGCKHVSWLDLERTPVTDAGLVHLAELDGLEQLGLGETAVTDAGLVHLKDLQNLVGLNLSVKGLTGSGLSHIARRKNLSRLLLAGTNLSDAGMEQIKDCTGLGELNLFGSTVTDAGLAKLTGLKQLNILNLGETKLSDAGLVPLKEFQNLGFLSLAGVQVTDQGLAHIADLKHLTALELNATQVTNAGLAQLKKLENLQALNLTRSQVDDTGLIHLMELKELEGVTLIDTGVTDASVDVIGGWSKLKHVRLQATKVTEAEVNKISEVLPRCKIEWDGGVIEPRAVALVRGEWRIVDDVIEHTTKSQRAMLLFGSPEFGDGDFTCEALRAEGENGLALVARATDLENYYYFEIGWAQNHFHSIYSKEAGTSWRRIDQQRGEPIPTDRWVKLHLKIRGDTFEGYVDEKLVVSGKDDRRLQGYIGLRTWNEAGKYRHLKFTNPEGKVLWEGLPELSEPGS